MRQWDGPKISNLGNSQQHACDFVFSNKNTIEVSGECILSAENMAKQFVSRAMPQTHWGAYSASQTL